MSEHFLKKTKIDRGQLVSVQNVPVVEQFEKLKTALEARGGSEAADLFAEPFINWGNDVSAITVSWYCNISGNARRLSALPAERRAEVEQRLERALGKAQECTSDPDIGRLVAGALSVPSADDILVVGGQPVITNWGMSSAEAFASPAAQNEHFAATLGRYLPLAAAPMLYATDILGAPPARAPASARASGMEGLPAGADGPTGQVKPTAAPAPGMQAASVAGTGSPAGLGASRNGENEGRRDGAPALVWPVAVLAAVLALVALWLLLPGTRLFPDDDRGAARALDDSSLELVRRLNEDLAERERLLQAALDGAVCTPDGSLVLPDGRLPDGLMPPPRDASTSPTETGRGEVIREGRSDAVVPPDPSRISVPDAPRPDGAFAEDGSAGAAPAPGEQNLVTVVEERTVLVIARNGERLGVGTGFFIAPDLVATNHHVIENAIGGGTIFVSNTALAELHPATIVIADGPFADTLADFALLRVLDVRAPYFKLANAEGSLKLQNVVAAGYPTDIMGTDYRFQQLLEGVSSAVPDLIFTDGVVNTEQAVSETRSLLVHSAPISKGNSGGPLVDTCGRVVGMNTFVREETFRNLNIAQSNRNFFEFLGNAGVTPSIEDGLCVPQVMRVSVPRAATVTPEDAPPAEAVPGTGTDPAPVEASPEPGTRPAEEVLPPADDPTAPLDDRSDSADVPPATPAPDPAAVPETEEADGATILDSPSDVSLAEADPAPERELDLGEPLPPGMLDTRRIEPETLE